MRKRLIIFDLDGTLLDTSGDLMNSMNKMLSVHGFPEITIEQTKAYIGNGARNFVLRSLPEEQKNLIDVALAEYNSIYSASGSPLTHIYEGISEVLCSIKSSGAMLAIASNKPQKSTEEVCSKYLCNFGFDYIYGNREGFAHKPEKDCGILILKNLHTMPEDTLIVGDGETDVKFAANLGCKFIGVKWGYRSEKVLKEAGADVFAETPKELMIYIQKFINKEV